MKKSIKIIFIVLVILAIIAGGAIFVVKRARGNTEIKYLTREELEQYKEEITITKENWKDYITTYEIQYDVTDDFETLYQRKYSEMKLKDNICGYVVMEYNGVGKNNQNALITLKGGHINVGQTSVVRQGEVEPNKPDNIWTVDDIECLRIRGYIYKLDIPENVWEEYSDEKGFLVIENGESSYVGHENEQGLIHSLSEEEYQEREKTR